MRDFTLIFAVLASAYGILLAYLHINNPFHDLLFQPPPLSSSLPQPYAVVRDLCLNNYYPQKPGNCFFKLMQIPSTKYATDSTQIIRILVDQVYNSSLTARSKFDHILSFQHTHLSSDSIKCLRRCQKSADDILSFWDDRFMNDKLFPLPPLGTVHHFWRRARIHVVSCLYHDERADNVVVKEFIHSVFDEIDDLVGVGNALKHKVQSFRSMRQTELKPMPLVAHHRHEWCPDPKRYRERGLPLEPEPTACRVLHFFSRLTSVLSSILLELATGQMMDQDQLNLFELGFVLLIDYRKLLQYLSLFIQKSIFFYKFLDIEFIDRLQKFKY